MTGRVVGGARGAEMGNESTGSESAVSIALASPFRERNMLAPFIIPQWLLPGAPQRGNSNPPPQTRVPRKRLSRVPERRMQ